MVEQIYADPIKQAQYEAIIASPLDAEIALARTLYAVERMGSASAYDGMATEDIAPIYRILARNLSDWDNCTAVITCLAKLHGDK